MTELNKLLNGVEIVSSSGDLNVPVKYVTLDSRQVKPGFCFVAIRGFKTNGVEYLGEAIANGATSCIFEQRPDETFPDMPLNLSWVLVKNARKVFSKVSAAVYNRVADHTYNVGITGTNGKTTITSLVHAIYNRETKTARIGTLGMHFADIKAKTSLTTPEAIDIFQFLSEAQKKGCKNMVMEVSSVALELYRANDIPFSQAIFTTFSGDHLDFHKTMEDYFKAKLQLFKNLSFDDWAVINIDDPSAPRILEQLECKYLTYGFSEDADIRPKKYKCTLKGIHATLQTPRGLIEIKSPLLGKVNLSNLMASVTSAMIKGISPSNIKTAIADFKSVKGRLDPVSIKDIAVMVDYAHTDNALESMLKSARELVSKRIILVFGAGGSRDKTKRPRMGNVASLNADFLVVTSDNPRQEDPEAIINDVVAGFDKEFKNFLREVDRERAIDKAIRMAQKGDLVVIAGKGHEDYQIFKDETIRFDDFDVARLVLDKIKKEKNA